MPLPENPQQELQDIYDHAKVKKRGEIQVHILGYLAILDKLDKLGAIVAANSVQPFEWPETPDA